MLNSLLQYDIYRAFWKAVRPPTPTSEKVNASHFCALPLRKSIAINLQPTLLSPPPPYAPKMWGSKRQGGSPAVSPQRAEGEPYPTLNRWLIISSSASCKPEHDRQPAMWLSSSWYRPSFALCSANYAHLSTPSFPCSFITKSRFAPEHGVWSRLIAICCFSPPRPPPPPPPPPRLFHNRAAWQGFFFFLKGAWQKAPPQDQTVRIWDNHNPPQLISDQTLLSSPVNDSFYSSALRCTTTTPPTPLTLMETGVKVNTGFSGPCVSRSKRCPPNRTKTASYPARNGAFLTNAVFNRNFHTPFSRGFSV